jgi:chromosome segregation ATPase
MDDNVENLILTQLREIRTDITQMKADLSEVKSGQSELAQKVDGLTIILGLLAGHVHHVEERVESLEKDRT